TALLPHLWRLLKLLLWIVPLCVAGGVALGLTISNAPAGEIIGRTVAITMTATVHLCFWVTAGLRRAGAHGRRHRRRLDRRRAAGGCRAGRRSRRPDHHRRLRAPRRGRGPLGSLPRILP